jgi:PAS domain S-box-containing protein
LEAAPSTVPSIPPTDPNLFKAIVEQTLDAIVFADRNGVIQVWNRGAELVFGFGRAEAVGLSLDLIIPERFRRAHWEGFRRAIESGHTRPGDPVRTTRAIHKDGRKLYLDLSFGIVTGETGAVIGAVAVGRDCSARHLAQRAQDARVVGLERPAPGGAGTTT